MMLFVALLSVGFAIYLGIEERERRRMNPNALNWRERFTQSAMRHLWFLSAVPLALCLQIVRDKDLKESLLQAAIGVIVFLGLSLHAATLQLPRTDKRS